MDPFWMVLDRSVLVHFVGKMKNCQFYPRRSWQQGNTLGVVEGSRFMQVQGSHLTTSFAQFVFINFINKIQLHVLI